MTCMYIRARVNVNINVQMEMQHVEDYNTCHIFMIIKLTPRPNAGWQLAAHQVIMKKHERVCVANHAERHCGLTANHKDHL